MARMFRAECAKRRRVYVREETGGQITEGFERSLFFNLNENGTQERILGGGAVWSNLCFSETEQGRADEHITNSRGIVMAWTMGTVMIVVTCVLFKRRSNHIC